MQLSISLWCVPDIMVQEFVEYGALDLYLKRGRSVSVSWKLDVAKQLASVLTFLVSLTLWSFCNNLDSAAAETHILLGKRLVLFPDSESETVPVFSQEQNNIVHGNICAKNLLLASEGDPSTSVSPFIKLSDPGISVVMLGREGKSRKVSLATQCVRELLRL